ncbi:type I glyceraldehyde-3-phosphate dehydrogenase [Methyloceanibacter caenitepidi]|uniref:Glyceraldehyde-3-phosphate dehydrogenase n=1 Tax=Methyloceanibacter caenitepidi TaxID=1384459 RepID=A0A0A8K3I6_9HYPH|nr:type I glyceraldehyde-3-phosphate dehydrogenase [Methyloceanibacter caenitepidi]BAQ17102.1 NAD-dependent glyceraldehyde-3-phosphate dehydrogenase [Methyloceanibacter caenitepidi]
MATPRVAINGFGRIGRLTFRAFMEAGRDDLDFVAINDLGSADMNALLLEYDTVHGKFPGEISVDGSSLRVNGKDVAVLAEPDPEKLPWDELGVDIVMECTGRFTKREAAAQHLKAGAKRVLVSAPCSGADLTVVYGVNDQKLTEADVVVSNASCTTNCLAPVAEVLHKLVGIERGYMTTIHAYTGDQRTVDTLHKDPRRARASAANLIPTSTGAAKAVGLVLPELEGKLDGASIRVPVPNVSLVDLTFQAGRKTSADEINEAVAEAASKAPLLGVLGVNDKPLVSSDFNHSPLSSVFDETGTQVIDGTFCRVVAWYDNEWGFSNRMSDTAVAMGRLL